MVILFTNNLHVQGFTWILCLQAYYYFAIVEDSILRFVWTLHVSLGEGILFQQREALTTILASFEVFR